VAIGGITVERVYEVLAAAAPRQIAIAVCAAILSTEDPEAATRALVGVVAARGA